MANERFTEDEEQFFQITMKDVQNEIIAYHKMKADEGLERCNVCGGSGEIPNSDIEPDCCGNYLESGSCCGNPIPVEVQLQPIPCGKCNETGWMKIEPKVEICHVCGETKGTWDCTSNHI